MADPEDYCELCDLPRSQCIHGRPPPEPRPKPKPTPAPRRSTRQSTRQAAVRTRTVSPAAPVRRRWTPPEAFKPLIVAVLEEAGGELEAEDAFRELEAMAADRLLPGDTETTPEGELRWRYAARRARVALIDDGVMVKSRPGLWQLADGRE